MVVVVMLGLGQGLGPQDVEEVTGGQGKESQQGSLASQKVEQLKDPPGVPLQGYVDH